MGRPCRIDEQRRELLPVVARAFAELGYRRATTAELARRCRVRENILYRLWPSKKAMFVASIDYVYQQSVDTWTEIVGGSGGGSTPAEKLLAYEAEHYGEGGLYRLIFAGLNETDDPDVHEALKNMYGRFHRFIQTQIADHQGVKTSGRADLYAWAFVGLATVVNIGKELGLMGVRKRKELFGKVGQMFLDSGIE